VAKGVQGGAGCGLVHSFPFCHLHAHKATRASLLLIQG